MVTLAFSTLDLCNFCHRKDRLSRSVTINTSAKSSVRVLRSKESYNVQDIQEDEEEEDKVAYQYNFCENTIVMKSTIDSIESLIKSYNEKKRLTISKQILGLCEQIEDKKCLKEVIDFLMANTIPNDAMGRNNNNDDDNSVYLTSLLQPRDQTDLIRMLGSRGMFYTMECLLKHIAINSTRDQKDRIKNMQYAYTAAITALAKSANPKYRQRSELLLDEMDHLGIPPNSYVITAILLAVEGGKAAKELIQRANGYSGIEVDVNVYNSAIYACSRGLKDGWQAALSLFREMPKRGLKPNQQTYASLLQACAKSGQVKVAFSLFEEMRKIPGMNRPGPKVWGAVLRACSIAGDWEKAINMILTMSSEGETINVIHMNSVLASLAKVGNDVLALDVLNAMQEGRNTKLRTIFSTSKSCMSVDNDCFQTLPFPDLVSINTVLTAFAERNNQIEAIKLLDRMKNGDFSSKQGSLWVTVKPDIISYNLVLSTFQQPIEGVELIHEVNDSFIIYQDRS